ncbi:hypothetical protein [Pseudomonas putida]|uniref:hypothetical protein n=1 Tax=Pseudomonas putida TaxID=303 RepID=UPI00069B2C37|nr:hypothetical protein [Pseudomonas putida]
MSKFLIFFFLFFSRIVDADEPATAKAIELCLSDEQVIFSCKAEHKIIAICASKNLSNMKGFAQYRVFDVDKNMTEFVFPETLTPPDRNFIIDTQPLPGGIDVKVKFSNNGFLYIIHERDTPIAEEGFEGHSEVIVRRNEKIIDSIKCINHDSQIRRAGYESFYTQD